jgi:hypothetical protein
MDQIPAYRGFTQGSIFFAEHARQYADDSGQLENEHNNRPDPPSHILFPP